MAVVFAARDGDERSTQEGREREEHAGQICSRPVDVALPRDEQAQVAQAAEAETAVPAGKAAPAVVEYVVVCLGAHFEGDELVGCGAGLGFAAREEIGARAADGVFDHVCDEEREEHAD